MVNADISLLEVRSKQVLRVFHDKPEIWGRIHVLVEPLTIDGSGETLISPFKRINFVGHPRPNKQVYIKNCRIYDALFVNCYMKDNTKKGVATRKALLRHHIRIFNAVLIKNILINCSIMGFEDFLQFEPEKRVKSGKIEGKSIVEFLRTYISTMRRFGSLLPNNRKEVLPDYVQFRSKIFVTICTDGIAIWFRRKIGKRRDTIKVSTKRFLRNLIPQLSEDKNMISVLNGAENFVIRNFAIVTQEFFDYMESRGYKAERAVLRIPYAFGCLEVKSGADIKLENMLFGYLDRQGKPKQIVLKALWIIANDMPSLFSIAEGKERAQMEFFDRLVKSGPIKGEKMKRYTEANVAREIEDIKKDYVSLISRENAEEPELQQFLENHPFILSPTYLDVHTGSLEITPQARLSEGKRKADFLILFEPDFEKIRRLVTVVELKRPSHKLFVKKSEPSKPLKVGLQQVEMAFKIINENSEEAEKLGINPSDNIRGMVLIGRYSDLEKKDISHLKELNKASTQIKIVTFDTLIKSIETVMKIYGAKGRVPAVVVGQKGTIDEDFTLKPGESLQEVIDYLEKRIESGQ